MRPKNPKALAVEIALRIEALRLELIELDQSPPKDGHQHDTQTRRRDEVARIIARFRTDIEDLKGRRY